MAESCHKKCVGLTLIMGQISNVLITNRVACAGCDRMWFYRDRIPLYTPLTTAFIAAGHFMGNGLVKTGQDLGPFVTTVSPASSVSHAGLQVTPQVLH